jgi:coenzyme F420-reducing hydrogenase beta subunit
VNVIKHNKKESHACCGCGVCIVACKNKALSMQISEEGFFIPLIDNEKCNNCGRCIKVCFKFLTELSGDNHTLFDLSNSKLYSAYSKDDDVVSGCSSGGFAYELSKTMLNDNYKICGVVYDTAKSRAVSSIATDVSQLQPMRGSKYLQSDTIDAFSEMINDKNNRYVVIGTPCQIYGISKLVELERIRKNYILVDFFCHGVPSYMVWDKYIEEIKKKYKDNKILSVNFRNKKYGWHTFCLSIVLSNHTIYQTIREGGFYKMFFDDVFFCRACYGCGICKRYGFSDLRIGDYWGEKFDENDKGVSIISVKNDVGSKIVESMANNLYLQRESLSSRVAFCEDSNKYILNESIRRIIIEGIQNGYTLKKIIKLYSRKFSFKRRIKNLLTLLAGFLPRQLGAKIRKAYHKFHERNIKD